jgi:nitric oxide reductase NorQ protein
MSISEVVEQFLVEARPNYISQSNEEQVFAAAFRAQIPLVLKGPTGCGKTRFVEYMAHTLGVPLITVSCHEDLTAADLVGRFLFRDNQTVWQDGPLTLAVRYGGICYLDEVVEARKDTTVIIHSLTDHRRTLYIDKTGGLIHAHPDFMMVLSYNPGYQSIVKDLKPSTKQRFASLIFEHPAVATEREIIHSETGLDRATSERLAEMGAKIRELQGFGLEEGVSSRLLVYVGRLMLEGLNAVEASTVAVAQTLTDDREVLASVREIVQLYFGELMELPDAVPATGS